MFTYRIPALQKLFLEQKADYYYAMMRSYLHLLPYWAAKKNGSKFILAVASDVDVLSAGVRYNYEYKANFKISRYLSQNVPSDLAFNYLMLNADTVTLQHSGQRFRSYTKRNNQVIFSNIIELDKLPIRNDSKGEYFIYAGSLTMLKGADNLLKLLNAIDKKIKIMIVGAPKDQKSEEIYRTLEKMENVTLMGWQNHDKTIELISAAKALFNTSHFEGFPNIFLEAWASGVPVISLNVNPGNIFDTYHLGTFCRNSISTMKLAMENFDEAAESKENMRSYVKEFHDFNTAADRFIKAISA
jgi:glycosyltransferase involved in cell wall biosynthesis